MPANDDNENAAEEYIQSFRFKTLDGDKFVINDLADHEKSFGLREYENKIKVLEKEIFVLKLQLFFHTKELKGRENRDTSYKNLQIKIEVLNEELKSKQQIIFQAAQALRAFEIDQQRWREVKEKQLKFQQFDNAQHEKYIAMQLRIDAMTRQIAALQTELSNKQQDIAEKDITVNRLKRELKKWKLRNLLEQHYESRHRRPRHYGINKNRNGVRSDSSSLIECATDKGSASSSDQNIRGIPFYLAQEKVLNSPLKVAIRSFFKSVAICATVREHFAFYFYLASVYKEIPEKSYFTNLMIMALYERRSNKNTNMLR